MTSGRATWWVAPASLALLWASALTTTEMAGCATAAIAQESAPDASALAEFTAGSEAANDQRWADALSHFERAYELSGRASAAYNMATALRALGRFAEAQRIAEALLERDDVPADVRDATAATLAEVRGRVATLRLLPPLNPPEAAPRPEEIVVRVDGAAREDWRSPLRLDPGPHGVSASAPDHEPWRWEGTLDEGEVLALRMALEQLPGAGGGRPGWVLPVSLAAAVVALAAAGLGVFLALDSAALSPRTELVLRP